MCTCEEQRTLFCEVGSLLLPMCSEIDYTSHGFHSKHFSWAILLIHTFYFIILNIILILVYLYMECVCVCVCGHIYMYNTHIEVREQFRVHSVLRPCRS